MGNIKETTDASFEADVLKADGPVLVDFWAPWCTPCRKVAPILEELAQEYAGKLTIVKLNTDENPTVTMKYGITSIPTLSVFVGGEVAKSISGARPKPMLVKELADFIG